jgi:hypothetical protein
MKANKRIVAAILTTRLLQRPLGVKLHFSVTPGQGMTPNTR